MEKVAKAAEGRAAAAAAKPATDKAAAVNAEAVAAAAAAQVAKETATAAKAAAATEMPQQTCENVAQMLQAAQLGPDVAQPGYKLAFSAVRKRLSKTNSFKIFISCRKEP